MFLDLMSVAQVALPLHNKPPVPPILGCQCVYDALLVKRAAPGVRDGDDPDSEPGTEREFPAAAEIERLIYGANIGWLRALLRLLGETGGRDWLIGTCVGEVGAGSH
jgi:hypothetical protein